MTFRKSISLLFFGLFKKRLLCVFASREHASGQSLFGRNHDVWYKVLSFLTMYNIDNPEERRVWDASQNEHLNEISRRIDALNPKTTTPVERRNDAWNGTSVDDSE